MRSLRVTWRFLGGLAVAGLLLAACESEKGRGETGEGPARVVVVGSQWYGHFPVWAGIEKGFFSDAGFGVEWKVIGKSMDRLNAISSGDAQFASLGEIAMLSAMSRGNDRFYWVGNQNIAPGFEGLVGRPGIRTFADLRGKTVGFPFGSSVDITTRLLLKDNGLIPGEDVKLVNLELGDVPAVFRAGNVDAAAVWEPGFSQLIEVEGARVLGMDTDTVFYREFGTMTGPDVLVLSRSWADQDPDRARRFLDAYFKALEWTRDHPEEAVDLAIAGNYIQQDRALLLENMGKFIWFNKMDQLRVMSEEGLFAQGDAIVSILKDDLKTISAVPDFRGSVNWEVLGLDPGGGPSGE